MEPNIYHAVVFSLHPKVREFLDQLDASRQIDRDETNAPHMVSLDFPEKSVHRCVFIRNGKPESFVLHTRRVAEPIRSWGDDGWMRPERPEVEMINGPSRRERERRALTTFEHIVEQILPRRK